MECPHLPDSAKVSAPLVSALSKRRSSSASKESVVLKCTDCETPESPWCCCLCGEIGCGRYVKGHMVEHHKNSPDHCVCMDCTNFSVYCYKCDEYVVNDSDSDVIQQLRTYFKALDPSYPTLDLEFSGDENQSHPKRRYRKRSHSDTKKRKTHPKTVGLRNLGNTCFMNSILQSLNNIPEFARYIHKLPSLEKISLNENTKKKPVSHNENGTKVCTRNGGLDESHNVIVVEEFRKTLVDLRQSKTALSPANLFSVIWKVVPNFRGYQQQDAHEFMRYLLDRLHQELLTLLPAYSTPRPRGVVLDWVSQSVVTAVFGGVLQSEVKCLKCGHASVKQDPFLDLSLDIPMNKLINTDKEPAPICTIRDCLKSFTDTEELEASERYTCSHCKNKQPSTKKFWIRRLPNVLCLHLKRFRWSSFIRTKIETYVEFPVEGLDVSEFQLRNMRTRDNTGSSQYDLAAVVVHHGSGAGSGHYTSYATHDNTWYHFNDSSVTDCSEDTVTRSKAYILFYVRRQLKL